MANRLLMKLLAVLIPLALLSGCGSNPGTSAANSGGTGSKSGAANKSDSSAAVVAGVVQLADPPRSGHAGISVFLGGTAFQARTDADGSFRIGGIPKGSYSVMAERPGYQTVTLKKLDLDPGRDTSDTPALIRGVLEKEGGELDATGGAGTSATAASRANRSSAAALGSLAGKVYLQNQDDSDGVRVQLEGTLHVTVSERDGSYRLINVEPGRYNITFSKPGFRTSSTSATIPLGGQGAAEEMALEQLTAGATGAPPPRSNPADTNTTAVLARDELSGDRTIAGLVEIVDPSSTDVPDYGRVTVGLENSDILVTPDGQGKYLIPNLPAALYKLTAAIDGGAHGQIQHQLANVQTEKSATVNFKFVLGGDAVTSGSGTVIGHIIIPAPPPSPGGGVARPAPANAAGVNVGLSGTQLVAVTDADGRFKIEKVPASTYTFLATKDGFNDLTVENVTVADGQTVDLGDLTLEMATDAPRVVSTSPDNGARSVIVGRELEIIVKFSKPMDVASVRRSVQISPDASSKMFMGNGSHPHAANDTLVIVLSNMDARLPIRYNTNYRITIGASATDTDGTHMREDYVLSFSTGGIGLVSSYPANGSNGSFINQYELPITLEFNGPLKVDSVSARTIRVAPSTDTYRAVVISDPATNFTTVRLIGNWSQDTQYTVTVTNGVRTFNNQLLSNSPASVHFRSGHVIHVPPPDPVERR